jgi:hypothetical protein
VSQVAIESQDFHSGDAFDDSTFFYQQFKFTWLVRIGIAVEFGGEVDCAQWGPNPALRHP